MVSCTHSTRAVSAWRPRDAANLIPHTPQAPTTLGADTRLVSRRDMRLRRRARPKSDKRFVFMPGLRARAVPRLPAHVRSVEARGDVQRTGRSSAVPDSAGSEAARDRRALVDRVDGERGGDRRELDRSPTSDVLAAPGPVGIAPPPLDRPLTVRDEHVLAERRDLAVVRELLAAIVGLGALARHLRAACSGVPPAIARIWPSSYSCLASVASSNQRYSS